MLKHMLTSALGAGLAAGLLAALLHFALVQSLILEAERYETGAAVHFAGATAPGTHDDGADHVEGDGHGHDLDTVAEDGAQDSGRNGLTVVFHVVTQVAYALLLVAGFGVARAFGREITPREGILWGVAGFAALQLAPALGLAPELPGTPGGELQARQVWWAMTALSTAGGLGLLAFGRNAILAAAGAALIVIPHLIGAPQSAEYGGVAPPELAAAFVGRVLGVGLAVWAALGWVAGRLWSAPAA